MNIALIYPPFSEKLEIFNEKLAKFYFQEGNVMPPLGLGYIAAILEREGHNVVIIDMNATQTDKYDLLNEIKNFSPQLLGFSVLTHIFPYTIDIVKFLKENYNNAEIIVGGQHVELYPESVLQIKSIDYAVRGEGEDTIKEFIQTYAQIKSNKIESDSDKYLEKIPGLIFRNNKNEVIINPSRKLIKDLDSIPFPSRHLFNPELYKTFFTNKQINSGSIIASRGCPFNCSYCAERFSNYRTRSVENILEELKEMYYKYKIRDIYFNDGTFVVNKKRIMNLCKKIIQENIKFTFNIRTRIDTMDEDLLKILKEAGCNRINYGLESGDEEILKRLNKNTSIKQIIKIIKLTKKYGITTWGFFLIGNPGETKETIEKTISLAKFLDLDFVQFSRLNVFPGCDLYKDFVEQTGNDIWLHYSMGEIYEKDILLPNSNFTVKELNNYVLKAYRKFYFRPKYILKQLRTINSFSQLFKFIKAALAII